MYYVSVNGRRFEIEPTQDGLIVDGQLMNWDLVKIEEGYFHILFQNKSYRAETVKTDAATKSFAIKVNGHMHWVELKDNFNMLLEKMGIDAAAGNKVNIIKAPMPGLIIDLKVNPGDMVKPGDPLLVLEAMKMENILKSTGEGTVKNVKVRKGDSVEKGQILLEF